MSDLVRTLETDALLERLPAVLDFVEEFFRDAEVPETASFGAHLAVDEVCTNIIRHAYADAAGPMTVICRREGDMVWVETFDRGGPFNPDAVKTPDITAPLEERPIGGLGIFLVRKMMDTVHYARDPDGRNHWRMGKRIG